MPRIAGLFDAFSFGMFGVILKRGKAASYNRKLVPARLLRGGAL